MLRNFLLVAVIFIGGGLASGVTLTSPDGQLVFELEVDDALEELNYTLTRAGESFLEASFFGVVVDAEDLISGVTAVSQTVVATEDFEYLTRGDRRVARNHYNYSTVEVIRTGVEHTRYLIEIRMYNEGLAFRYEIPGYDLRTISGESSAWTLPTGSKVWYQDGPAHEGIWLREEIGTVDGVFEGPLTVEMPDGGGYLHLSEAGLGGYPSMSFEFVENEQTVRSVFPTEGSWSMDGGGFSPWRVVLATEDLQRMLKTDIFTGLSSAARHISYPGGFESPWLQPGRALWSAWSVPDSARDFETQQYYIDEAARLGFEYIVVGSGWQAGFTEEGFNFLDRLVELVDYGRSDGRDVGVWVSQKYTSDFNIEGWKNLLFGASLSGAVGVKVDFEELPDRDTSVRNLELEEIAEVAGVFELMVTFHGVPNFHGLSRTHPNVMNWEGVRGLEYNRFPGAELSPEHNAVLAFTRFVSGPVDYTPLTLTASKMGSTTVAHQLAMTGIVTSPLLTIAESPSVLKSYPLVEEALVRIPASWDETILLDGSGIGQMVIKARRSGDDWYVFCINGDSVAGKSIDLPLSFLGEAIYDLDFYSDVAQFEIERSERFNLIATDVQSLELLPGGGCVGIFTKRSDQNRSFHLGFGTFPLLGDVPGIQRVYSDIERRGELIRHSFNGGIPWDSAASGYDLEGFPLELLEHWQYLKNRDQADLPDHAVYLVVSPFNTETYSGLAPNWGASSGDPLPSPWDTLDFNSDAVKLAYVNYLVAMIVYFDPDYVSIGEDANLILTYSPEEWNAYLELNAYAYTRLKAFFPDLPILTSIQYEHMLGLNEDAAATAALFTETYPDLLQNEVEVLMEHSDVFGFSSYPYLIEGNQVFDGDYFQVAYDMARRLELPVAIDQTGYISEDYTLPGGAVVAGSEELQSDYLEMLLRDAYDRQFYFVVNGVVRDYSVELYPEATAEIAGTGLVRDTGDLKEAEDVWSDYMDLSYYNLEIDQGLRDSDGDGVNDLIDVSPDDPLVSSLHVFFNDDDGDQYGDDTRPYMTTELVPQTPLVIWGGDTSDYSKLAVPQVYTREQRVIGFDLWDTTSESGDDYDHFLEQGAEVVTLRLAWQDLELPGGLFSGDDVLRLREAVEFCRAHDLEVCLSVDPVQGEALMLPDDLSVGLLSGAVTWGAPEVVGRFHDLLDAIDLELGDVVLSSLVIGINLDQYDPSVSPEAFWGDYRSFLDQVAVHVDSLWGVDLPLGVALSVDGLDQLSGYASSFQSLLDFGDFTGLTLKYTNDVFELQEPTGLLPYLGGIFDRFPARAFQFIWVSCPSSPHTRSSTTKQSQFYIGFFDFWDRYIDQLPFASFGAMADAHVSAEVATAFVGDVDLTKDYYESLGLVTVDGEKKPAYHTLRDLSFNRGWWVLPEPQSRSFNLGFTTFPYDEPVEEAEYFAMQDWMSEHLYEFSDIINLQFDGGIPWLEALADDMTSPVAPYPDYVLDFWAELRDSVPVGHQMIVTFSPTGVPRSKLNGYWGVSREVLIVDDVGEVIRPGGEEEVRFRGFLPEPWDKYRFNDPDVKEALVKYAKRMVQFFEPDYLLVGLEASESIPEDVSRYYEYIELQQHLYSELKADAATSDVPIIVSISSTSLMKDELGIPLKYEQHPFGQFQAQVDGLAALLPYIDILGLSHYPHFGRHNAFKIPTSMYENFFKILEAAGASDMPIAITESGYAADPYVVLDTPFIGSPEKQDLYFKHMFYELEKGSNPIEFIINYEIRDTDYAWYRDYQRSLDGELNPLVVEFLQYFRDIGLYDGDGGDGRPALATWASQLRLPLLSKDIFQAYPKTYFDWMQRFTMDDSLLDPLLDLDGDRQSNLLEYALAGNPIGSSEGAPTFTYGRSDGFNFVTFQYRRNLFAGDIEMVLEHSNDLTEWDPVDLNSSLVAEEVLYWAEEDDAFVEVVEVSIAIVDDSAPLFLRLRAVAR